MTIRVAIVENEFVVRKELVALLDESDGFECLGAYTSGEQALREIPKNPPHVVLMDINLGQMSGVKCTYLLKQVLPELQIVMLTVYGDRNQIFEALETSRPYGRCIAVARQCPAPSRARWCNLLPGKVAIGLRKLRYPYGRRRCWHW